ncbi:MAG TPA: hypothetical protein VFV10_13570 [Gammaproteobacteria bacterium]|nr:hypothetical protein [Gammaproteobacteria bacterium]
MDEPGSSAIPELARLREEGPRRGAARLALGPLSVLTGSNLPAGLNELAQSLYLWFNIAFLLELVVYVRTIDRFLEIRLLLQSTFDAVGAVDAAVAVASYLELHPDHCRPAVADERVIDIQGGRHPLIAEPVENSIRLEGRSALIAGSNMAGKTTFIKMVAINLIFGRTLGFCFASKAAIPRSSVMASIRGEHSVASGKSHYFAEVEAIHAFIESARRGDCAVFVIDELFRGTNTVERLAIARAVLESLCENAQLLVTTHDVELQALLAGRYDLYHFQEDPDVEGFFDYRLRAGATRARNAIRLLERMAFQDDVVARAMSYAAATDEDVAAEAQ